jgi:hypothetical protein
LISKELQTLQNVVIGTRKHNVGLISKELQALQNVVIGNQTNKYINNSIKYSILHRGHFGDDRNGIGKFFFGLQLSNV